VFDFFILQLLIDTYWCPRHIGCNGKLHLISASCWHHHTTSYFCCQHHCICVWNKHTHNWWPSECTSTVVQVGEFHMYVFIACCCWLIPEKEELRTAVLEATSLILVVNEMRERVPVTQVGVCVFRRWAYQISPGTLSILIESCCAFSQSHQDIILNLPMTTFFYSCSNCITI
jgi:hypothetical protein